MTVSAGIPKPKLLGVRNQYATQCLDCGSLYPPDSGRLYQRVDDHWYIRCDACASKDEVEPKSRLDQRKAAWKEFRKPVSQRDADGHIDRPGWKAFLAIWSQCAGFDADFRERMAEYREEFKATAPARAKARAEAGAEAERRREESTRKHREDYEARVGHKVDWSESWEARREREYREYQRDNPTGFACFMFWCQDFGKEENANTWWEWLDPGLREMWETLHRLIQSRKGMTPDISCLAALGLTPPVTVDAVKAAFRSKVREAHPDHGGDANAFVALRSHYEHAIRYAEACH